MNLQSRLWKSLRVIALAFCAAAVCAVPMLAQDTSGPPAGQQGGRGNPAEMQQRRLDMMTRQLSLTPDQVTGVKAIMDAQQVQVQALRNGGASGGDMRSQMMNVRQASSAKIRALLTDDQKPKFDEMEARMAQRQAGGGQGGPPPPPPPAL